MMQNVDSVTMGSPPHHLWTSSTYSPSTSLPHASHGATYLPPYLMGEALQPSSAGSRSWLGGSSPPRSSGGSIQRRNFTPNTPHSRSDQTLSRSISSSGYYTGDSAVTKQKAGAPPAVGLMESLTNPGASLMNTADSALFDTSPANQSTQAVGRSPLKYSSDGSLMDDNTNYFNLSRKDYSPSADVSSYTSRQSDVLWKEKSGETWVTIFGFSPSATSYVLDEFAQYGNILRHVISPNGNWMYVQYQSDLQARKALSKNGKVFGGNIMIGVVPCLDRAMLEPLSPQTLTLTGPDSNSRRVRPSSMRHLASRYDPYAKNSLMIREDKLPEKNNSMISRALEYVFGW